MLVTPITGWLVELEMIYNISSILLWNGRQFFYPGWKALKCETVIKF